MDLGEKLNELYLKYNDRKYVHPDPLEFLYNYPDLKDREIAGLIAALLAYGRVSQILKSVSSVLNILSEPFDYLKSSKEKDIFNDFKNFKHRFTDGKDLANLLVSIKEIINEYGSLNNCFYELYKKYNISINATNSINYNSHNTILDSLRVFIKKLIEKNKNGCNSLLSNPDGSSAFKRFNLYLRWMVRKDNVDPGGWDNIPSSKLIVPLDTHMYKICCNLRFTTKKQANIKAALDITELFRSFAPDDPVKFDFSLTRLGMNKENDLILLLKESLVN